MLKNTASQKLTIFAFDYSTNAPKTGDAANLTAYVSIDDGAVTALTDTSATEMDSTNAKGLYTFDLTQGETNGNKLVFSAKSSTSNVSIVPQIVYTRPPNFPLLSVDSNGRVDVIKVAGTTQTAGDIVGKIGTPESATVSTDISRVKDFIEYQRGQHTATGSVFYVDGVSGNDTTGNGSRSTPYKTISKALSVCTSNAHDCVILLPNSGGGPTTITESASISVTKNYVQIRGPGRDVNVTLNTSGHVFNISASGVQLSGMRITTFSGASSDGVNINSAADFVSIRQCWIGSSHRDGVQLNVANNCFVEDCQITSAGRDAIRITSGSGSGNYNKILRNSIRGATAIGINLQGSDASNCRVQHNLVRDCITGITIASGVSNTSVTDNRFAGNTTNLSDSGTATQHEWNRLATNISNGGVLTDSITADAITASAIAADAIGSSELATTAITEIQSGLATAAALTSTDSNVSAIKAKTDSLAFTVAGQVDANIQYVNDVAVTGDGQSGTEWGP